MKIKYFVAGMISLIVFGLLLPQPIQALFVYTSLKSFFDSHLVLLCILGNRSIVRTLSSLYFCATIVSTTKQSV